MFFEGQFKPMVYLHFCSEYRPLLVIFGWVWVDKPNSEEVVNKSIIQLVHLTILFEQEFFEDTEDDYCPGGAGGAPIAVPTFCNQNVSPN